jgi:hypothetical protein
MNHAFALSLLLLALSACTKPNKHQEGAAGRSQAKGSCGVTLAGAQTGSFKCGGQDSPDDGPLFTYDQAKGEANVIIAFNAPGDAPEFQCGLRFKGKPTVGTTYSYASLGASDGQARVNRGDQRWRSTITPLVGAMTIVFTTLDGPITVGGTTAWSTMHGTIVATIPAAGGGAKGIVTATATF